LRSIAKGFPSLPLFVFNGFMIPGIAEKALEYKQVQYCEDPQELDRYVALILDELPGKKRGTIEGIRLTNFLEWLIAEKLSGQVIVSNGKKQGVLYLEHGRLLGASTGGPSDRTALAEISSWEKVTVEIQEGPALAPHPRGGMPPAPAAGRSAVRPSRSQAGGDSAIETLRLTRNGKPIVLRIHALKQLIAVIRGMLGEALLQTDVFLSADGHSLAGWNSHPAACSAFAAITRSLIDSLATSRFPSLGNNYLLDLEEDRQALVVVCGELQLGMLLVRSRIPQGLLTHAVIPRALLALRDPGAIEYPD
jgi:hypothetical protein